MGERQIPFRMVVATALRRTETEVVTERYELRADIPDRLFSVVNLEAGDATRDRIRSAGGVDPDALPSVAAPPPD